MALAKELVAVVVVAILTVSVQSALIEDYPEIELPGVALPREPASVQHNADPCCLPKQWQGNLTSQTGISGGRGGTKYSEVSNVEIFVDETNKRIAGRGDGGGRFHNKTGGFIVLFNSNSTADIYFFSSTPDKCFHKSVNNATFKPQCVPANATSRDFSLGPSTGGLNVRAFTYRGQSSQNRGGKIFVRGTFIAVPANCIPVSSSDVGVIRRGLPRSDEKMDIFDQSDDDLDMDRPGRRGSVRFISQSYYYNVQPSIKDPAVFTVPSFCKNATVTNELLFDDNEPMQDVLERFVSF